MDVNSPQHLVEALGRIIHASRRPEGPTMDEAIGVCQGLDVPQDWLVRLLAGWADYARRYKKPLFPALVSMGRARTLEARMLRGMRAVPEGPVCTLCGMSVTPPRRSWHKECWEALEPHTSSGWQQTCRQVLGRAAHKCEHCLVPLAKHWGNADYQFDHVVPVALGGTNHITNVQVICSGCHKTKTIQDMILIRAQRKG